MKTKTMTILTADEGNVLTNGSLYLHTVIVSDPDTISSWSEVSESEYQAAKARRLGNAEPDYTEETE